jgi:hypothetical protein
MATVVVKITDTLERIVTVMDALSVDAALDSVRADYKREDIVLDSGDFTDVTFSAEKVEEAEKC